MVDTPRAYTHDEVLDMYLGQMMVTAQYWANLKDHADKDKCEGLVFSILCILDGSSSLPGMKCLVDPHPEDKQYHKDERENWFESGMEINLTHELLHRVNKSYKEK